MKNCSLKKRAVTFFFMFRIACTFFCHSHNYQLCLEANTHFTVKIYNINFCIKPPEIKNKRKFAFDSNTMQPQ